MKHCEPIERGPTIKISDKFKKVNPQNSWPSYTAPALCQSFFAFTWWLEQFYLKIFEEGMMISSSALGRADCCPSVGWSNWTRFMQLFLLPVIGAAWCAKWRKLKRMSFTIRSSATK